MATKRGKTTYPQLPPAPEDYPVFPDVSTWPVVFPELPPRTNGKFSRPPQHPSKAVAPQIQLYMQYHPEPPFDAGIPERAPAEIVAAARDSVKQLTARRIATAKRVGARLGIAHHGNAGSGPSA